MQLCWPCYPCASSCCPHWSNFLCVTNFPKVKLPYGYVKKNKRITHNSSRGKFCGFYGLIRTQSNSTNQEKVKCAVEPRYNEPLCNDVLGTTNDLLYPSNGKNICKSTWKPGCIDHVLPVPPLAFRYIRVPLYQTVDITCCLLPMFVLASNSMQNWSQS